MKRIVILILSIVLFVLASVCSSAEVNYINRAQFCELIIQAMKDRGTISYFKPEKNPFVDTQNNFVLQANALGFVNGDGNNKFYPDAKITKEQAAVIIKRVQDYIIPNLIYDNTKQNYVYDTVHASEYAVGPIKCLSMTNTIDGGNFYPKDNITREFVWSTMDRVYRNISLPVSHPGYISTKYTPVLMYHCVSAPSDTTPYKYLFVTPQSFDEQIKYLCQQGYTFLFPDEMYYADHVNKAVVITFDDGYADNYYEAYKVLKKYGAKATIFVACNNIDQEGKLTKAQIREMAESGLVNIGSHTLSHKELTKLDKETLKEEMAGSQWLLSQITGKKITNIAYPFGWFTNDVTDMAKRYYSTAFSVNQGSRYNNMTIPRITIAYGIDIAVFPKYL